MQFRRAKAGSRPFPQERRGTAEGMDASDEQDWRDIQFHQNCYVSRELSVKFLPNKVSSWICYVPIRSLVKFHHYKGATPTYSQLQEVPGDRLIVTYDMCVDDAIEYICPLDGRLGQEKKGNSVKPLIWSEVSKTLWSPHMDCPLPNKVASWLFHWKCLVSLVPPRKADGDEQPSLDTSFRKVEETDSYILWRNGEQEFKCEIEQTSRGFIYHVAETGGSPEPLVWNAEHNTWHTKRKGLR